MSAKRTAVWASERRYLWKMVCDNWLTGGHANFTPSKNLRQHKIAKFVRSLVIELNVYDSYCKAVA